MKDMNIPYIAGLGSTHDDLLAGPRVMRDANGESSRSVPSREQHGRQLSRLTLQMSYATTVPSRATVHAHLSAHVWIQAARGRDKLVRQLLNPVDVNKKPPQTVRPVAASPQLIVE